MNLIDYREKLGIAFCDKEKVELFLAKAYMAFSETVSLEREITATLYNNYCFNAGIKAPVEYYSEYTDGYKAFQHLMQATEDFKKFLYYYTVFLNSAKKDSSERNEWIKAFKYWASESGLLFEFYEDGDNVFIFPQGAKELDDALVSEPLEWLSEYPQAHKTYCIALKQYSDGIYIRDVADNLRKAFEEFLREFLVNNNDLNKNKKEIENYLKSQNADPQLITMLVSLISHYYLLNNEVAKHNDKVDEKYLEYLLYQTGVFIRMLLVVKNAKEVLN